MGRHGLGGVGGVKYHDKHWGICVGMHGNVWVGWGGWVMWGGWIMWGGGWCGVGGVKLHDKH